tara:strand:- start:1271 stop:2332 length:1062 start_codon:yes stop_codon:yes gene_type:complete
MHYLNRLYIFFPILSLIIFPFSTTGVKAKSFDINNIEISKPFKNNFDKNKVIESGFKKAFMELTYKLTKSYDHNKLDSIKLNEIKGMIETFSIQEEKFINQVYFVNLGVSFNKKKIFEYLEKRNIYPSQIKREKFLFIPIIIDEDINELRLFSNNPIYKKWNLNTQSYELINYILPSEDLEDFNLIKKNLEVIETYDFSEITKKYFLNNFIISLIYISNNEIKVLSKMYNKKNEIIKNNSFKNLDLNIDKDIIYFKNELKNVFEDTWKKINEINTSIKLSIIIKIKIDDLIKSSQFELDLDEIELVNDYSIQKFDKEFIFYEILFNGTVKNFINLMDNKNYKLNTEKKIWTIE